MDEDTPVVKEIKRQAVILTFSVLGALALVVISTMERDETTRARTVMRGAQAVKRFAYWNADMWETLALKASTVYNRYRDY